MVTAARMVRYHPKTSIIWASASQVATIRSGAADQGNAERVGQADSGGPNPGGEEFAHHGGRDGGVAGQQRQGRHLDQEQAQEAVLE